MKICSVKGCGKKHDSRGYCSHHAYLFRTYGDPSYQSPVAKMPCCPEGFKRCIKCLGCVAVGGFRTRPNKKDNVCDKCRNSRVRTRYATDSEFNVRMRVKGQRQYVSAPEKAKERARKRRAILPKKTWKYYSLKCLYGMTPEDWETMLEEQRGLCAVCHRPETSKKRTLSVDHNHATGKIRGLLCSNCNVAIGLLKDSTENLTSAIEYLKRTAD